MPPPTQDQAEEEERVFEKVIKTFNNYAQWTLSANNRRRKDIYTLPRADQELLDAVGYKQKLEEVDKAIQVNADFLHQIVDDPNIFVRDPSEDEQDAPHGHGGHSHSHEHGSSHSHSHSHSHGNALRRNQDKPTEMDMDKLRSTLKQLVRDWSDEGAAEREVCYKPMTEALVNHFAHLSSEARRDVKVLVPGSGLGRLMYEVAKLGFACQGNEFSHYMLLTSYFVLNKTNGIKEHTFYPYVHSFSNAPNKASLLRAVSIPDVLPSDLPPGSNFSLAAGDFEEIFGDPESTPSGSWDAVLSCFFIDTAKNIVNYLRIIHRILAPGGVWVNLGPLLWHWENNDTNDPSVELDLEETKELIRKIGFKISNERTIPATYTNNSASMLGYVYQTSFFTATKI
ncbi:hypothetical protein D9619_010108 [Psilocybe cf. subviscida]|uniref:carnosine N-methyltransferase n=1 Tax=Psilocybe cf. subviscida TaxID=2480587 RepID=A0A8H5BM37_9AGAR|nr:hypothetical protein D9619_010108 [Psilocybe cf. subviscida]